MLSAEPALCQPLPLLDLIETVSCAGEKFSITDIEQVKKGVMGSREPGRKGKYFLEG